MSSTDIAQQIDGLLDESGGRFNRVGNPVAEMAKEYVQLKREGRIPAPEAPAPSEPIEAPVTADPSKPPTARQLARERAEEQRQRARALTQDAEYAQYMEQQEAAQQEQPQTVAEAYAQLPVEDRLQVAESEWSKAAYLASGKMLFADAIEGGLRAIVGYADQQALSQVQINFPEIIGQDGMPDMALLSRLLEVDPGRGMEASQAYNALLAHVQAVHAAAMAQSQEHQQTKAIWIEAQDREITAWAEGRFNMEYMKPVAIAMLQDPDYVGWSPEQVEAAWNGDAHLRLRDASVQKLVALAAAAGYWNINNISRSLARGKAESDERKRRNVPPVQRPGTRGAVSTSDQELSAQLRSTSPLTMKQAARLLVAKHRAG